METSDRLGELGARVDAELPVDVAQVVLDRLRAEKHRGRRLPSGTAVGEEQGDLELLGRQLVERRRVPLPGGLARRLELGTCEVRPWLGAEGVEDADCLPKLLSCPNAPARTPEPRAVAEVRPAGLEDVGRLAVSRRSLVSIRGGNRAPGFLQPRR